MWVACCRTPREEQASAHASKDWQYEGIAAARRAPECLGGYEYRVKWGDRYVDTWEPEAQFIRRAVVGRDMREEMTRAREEAMEPSSFYEALEMSAETRPAESEQVNRALRGDPNDPRVARDFDMVLDMFLGYAEGATIGDPASDNIAETPATRGGSAGWEARREEWQTAYLGAMEDVEQEEGEEKPKQRRRVGLEAWTAWEHTRPPEHQVADDIMFTLGAEDELRRLEALMAGEEEYASVVPPSSPSSTVRHELQDVADRGMWADASTYEAISREEIRADPVTRVFPRYDEMEVADTRGGEPKGARTREGKRARMSKQERQVLKAKGNFESARAMRVALALHHMHFFTDAAATDGSADSVRRPGGSGKRMRASYGVWEGVQPQLDDGFDPDAGGELMRGESARRVGAAVSAGMWGGALPEGWDNNDAEAYAILAYLRSVAGKPNASERRVLVMSDSLGVLQQIESMWRAGKPKCCRGQDRGCMLEAICSVRAELGRVVMMWVPGHEGVSANSMADAVAKAHQVMLFET